MDSREFIQFCEAAEHGGERFVRLVDRAQAIAGSEQIGRVLTCNGRRFEVETTDGRHSWPMERCEPVPK